MYKENRFLLAFIIIAVLLFLFLLFGIINNVDDNYFIILILVTLFILLGTILQTYRKILHLKNNLDTQINTLYKQIESVIGIYQYLKPVVPLPSMSGYAINSNLAVLLMQLLNETKPKIIMELGTGVSTILFGYWAKENDAKIISIEHDINYLKSFKRKIITHNLQDNIELYHLPLTPIVINGIELEWYNLQLLDNLPLIDFLLIDGPPGHLHPFSRYPALPLLEKNISKSGTIILDDGERDQERKIIDRWNNEYPQWVSKLINFGNKSVFILQYSLRKS